MKGILAVGHLLLGDDDTRWYTFMWRKNRKNVKARADNKGLGACEVGNGLSLVLRHQVVSISDEEFAIFVLEVMQRLFLNMIKK